jgi:hypothetical protein
MTLTSNLLRQYFLWLLTLGSKLTYQVFHEIAQSYQRRIPSNFGQSVKAGRSATRTRELKAIRPFISIMGQRESHVDQVQARKAQVQVRKHCPLTKQRPSSLVLGHPKARLVSAARKLIEPNTTTEACDTT